MSVITKTQISYDFYIVNTPRHWWVSQAMASYLGRPAILLIFEGFNGSSKIYDISLSQKESPFSKIILVPGKLSDQSGHWLRAKLYRKFEWFRAKQVLRRTFINYLAARILTANVNSVHIQYLYLLSQKQNSRVSFHVLDDGLQSYHDETRHQKNRLSLIYASITHGFKVKSSAPNILFPFFSDGWFFNASLVHKRFAHLKCHNISNIWFDSAYIEKIRDQALLAFGLSVISWNQPKIVFVFTKLSLLIDNCKEFNQVVFEKRIQDFVIEHGISKYTVWVKYHPREFDKDPFRLSKKFNFVQFVPSSLPFELLSSSLQPNDLLVGEQSTVLFDVAVNRKDVSVYSLGCSERGSDIGNLFESVGVKQYKPFPFLNE